MPLAKLYEVMLPDTGFSLETLNDGKRNPDFYFTRCQIGLEAMSNPQRPLVVGHKHHLLFPEMAWGTDFGEAKRGRQVEC